jgi:hypothetical protein
VDLLHRLDHRLVAVHREDVAVGVEVDEAVRREPLGELVEDRPGQPVDHVHLAADRQLVVIEGEAGRADARIHREALAGAPPRGHDLDGHAGRVEVVLEEALPGALDLDASLEPVAGGEEVVHRVAGGGAGRIPAGCHRVYRRSLPHAARPSRRDGGPGCCTTAETALGGAPIGPHR